MAVTIPTLDGKTDYQVQTAIKRLVDHANLLERQVADAHARLTALPAPLSLQQIRAGLSATGATPLNLTGLLGGSTGSVGAGTGITVTPPGIKRVPRPIPNPPPPGSVQRYTAGMGGLTVVTGAYGSLPWFGAALTSLNPADRAAVYAAELAVGSTHCMMDISWNYGEPGQPYGDGPGNIVPPMDMTGNLPGFVAIANEIIAAGMTPLIFLAGDGENPSMTRDPGGYVYGRQWLTANIGAIVGAFAGLLNSVVFVPGFDGVMPGWDPLGLEAYLVAIRTAVGTARCVGLELGNGYCHWGGGIANWLSPAGQAVDVILQEFELGPYPANANDQIFQIGARELGANYTRPIEQDPADDPTPPYYLGAGTPRGPYTVVGFEFDTYLWVRSAITGAQVALDRAYLNSVGYTITG